MTIEPQPIPKLGEWPADEQETVTACPACGETARSLLHRNLPDQIFECAPGWWTYYRCAKCQSAYLDPRPTPESIGKAYSAYYTHSSTTDPGEETPTSRAGRLRRALRNGYLNARNGSHLTPASPLGPAVFALLPKLRARNDRWVRNLRPAVPGARLLDVGCANGAFVRRANMVGWNASGIDPDPAAVAAAQESGLDVRQGLLDEDTFAPESFDAITLSHVIEHLHRPVETLRRCHSLLKKGGEIWIATPNLAAQGYKHFGPYWYGIDPPRHLVLFTPESLRETMEAAGFAVGSPLPTNPFTDFYFRFSGDIGKRLEPARFATENIPERARIAEEEAWKRPEIAEELVLVGKKK